MGDEWEPPPRQTTWQNAKSAARYADEARQARDTARRWCILAVAVLALDLLWRVLVVVL